MTGSLSSFSGLVLNRNRYFPSIRTILVVRFDPSTKDRPGEVRTEEAVDPYIAIRAKRRFSGLVSLETGPQSLLGGRAAITSALANLGSAVAKGIPSDGLTRVLDVQPLKSDRDVNSYRIADELALKFAWKDVPFDARLIRSIFALHYEGTVSADAFGTGERELAPEVPVATGYVVPATGATLRFIGQVDEVTDDHSVEGDHVTMKLRDLTALFIDTKFPQDAQIVFRPGATLLDALSAIRDTLLPDVGIIRGPFVRPHDLPLPVLDARRYSRLATRAQGRVAASGAGGQASVVRNLAKAEDASYWDVITDVCVSHGFVPFIDLDRLCIQEPRTFFRGAPEEVGSQTGDPTFPTAYRKRIGDTTNTVRRVRYGQDLESLRFHRKLARVKAPAVRVSSYNPDAKDASKRLLSVTHPPNAEQELRAQALARKSQGLSKATKLNTGFASKVDPHGNSSLEIHNVIVHGIVDPEILRKVAESVYESMGRGELGITVTTSDLASISDHPLFDPNEDPDLLAIRAGDPLQILVEPTDRRTGSLFSISELNLMIARVRRTAAAGGSQASEFADATAYLQARGFSEADARQLVKILANANLPDVFRVNAATVSFDMEAGDVEIKIDARDYVRVRADPDATASVVPAQNVGGQGSQVG